ncbi:MAG: YbaK/EbsC family protein [Deltaproteobacteria bacterium]|nr:YbaK/EbsC family protein [Deltaproteobacteria bacterium]
MSFQSVKAFFEEKGYAFDIREFTTSTENVELAARALGVEPSLIAKTLAFKGRDRDILVVMKGDAKVDNKKFKDRFQVKSKMMPLDEVEAVTGHPVGGVCPFGLKHEMDIYADVSLKQCEKVYPAAGSKNTCIEITPENLVKITGASWVDVCK